jgi:rhodanese-related sulfurtransferase
MHVKLLVEADDGRLLGAQIVGEHGVDKRIDVLATALFARLKVADLENLDLAYAPQFSSAKDPVIMAGFAAANVGRREVDTITAAALQSRLEKREDIQLVDVRTAAEYESEHLEGARLIPIDELRDRLHELDPKKESVVYCKVGFRGYLAARILRQNGFDRVLNLTGGLMICQKNVVLRT